MKALAVLALLAAGAGPESSPQESLEKGVQFLLRNQNQDGSWGSHFKVGPYDEFWWNFETHRAWRRATTALCCMALMEQGAGEAEWSALERGINFLVEEPPVKRPSDWDTDNVWSYVYAMQGLARACGYPGFHGKPILEKIRPACERELRNLAAYQTPNGGWAYYDFETMTKRPSWATSFTTAATVVGLVEAKDLGLPVDEKMLQRAIKAVARCRLPSGAYTYSVVPTPSPGGLEWIDQVKGSLGRIQVGNLALYLGGGKVTKADLKRGLEQLLEHNRFLECARKRPIPHEAYYLNSGYFVLFAYHYAAMVVEKLPADEQGRYWRFLQDTLTRIQEKDGSTWDYYMNDYHKFYGTAYAVMALGRSLKARPKTHAAVKQ